MNFNISFLGKSGTSHDAVIQTITSHIRKSKKASPVAQEKHDYKNKEKKELIAYAKQNNLIFDSINASCYLSRGA